jgi:hypothetical protein
MKSKSLKPLHWFDGSTSVFISYAACCWKKSSSSWFTLVKPSADALTLAPPGSDRTEFSPCSPSDLQNVSQVTAGRRNKEPSSTFPKQGTLK